MAVDVIRMQLSAAKVAPMPLLLLLKAPPTTFSAPDVPNPYRPCSDFLYLSGWREPGAILAIYTNTSQLDVARSCG